MNKKLFRILACVELMAGRGRLRFLTLTVKEGGVPLRIVADRFRAFSNSRWWRKLVKGKDYICVYEPHPNGHGWHIHILTNFFIPWQQLQFHASVYGFGHTDIEACNSSMGVYIGKYLSKSKVLRAFEGASNVRLVNVSRSLLPLYDVLITSPSIDYVRNHWRLWDGFGKSVFKKYLWIYLNWVSSFCTIPADTIGERFYYLDPTCFYE